MRIISPFKDYYDNVVQDYTGRVYERLPYCIDVEPLYSYKKHIEHVVTTMERVDILNAAVPCPLNRENQQLIITIYNDVPKINEYVKINDNDRTLILGVAGKLYTIYLYRTKTSFEYKTHKVFFTLKEYLTHCHKEENKERRGMFTRSIPYDDFMRKYSNNKDVNNLFHILNTPLFMITTFTEPLMGGIGSLNRGVILFVNPILNRFGLQKAFNPYVLYQDIDRFINNDLVKQEDCNIKRTDELIRDSKGMDKFSFRQVGPKERKRK
jgi:hypothetical protein